VTGLYCSLIRACILADLSSLRIAEVLEDLGIAEALSAKIPAFLAKQATYPHRADPVMLTCNFLTFANTTAIAY